MDAQTTLYIDMNEQYEVAYNRIRTYWDLKPVYKSGYAHIAFVNKKNGNMGHMIIEMTANQEVLVSHRVEVMYNYRGYVRRIQTHFNEYNIVKRKFYSLNSDAFSFWVIRFMDYCRSMQLTDDILRDEIEYMHTVEQFNQLTSMEYTDAHLLPLDQKYKQLLNIA